MARSAPLLARDAARRPAPDLAWCRTDLLAPRWMAIVIAAGLGLSCLAVAFVNWAALPAGGALRPAPVRPGLMFHLAMTTVARGFVQTRGRALSVAASATPAATLLPALVVLALTPLAGADLGYGGGLRSWSCHRSSHTARRTPVVAPDRAEGRSGSAALDCVVGSYFFRPRSSCSCRRCSPRALSSPPSSSIRARSRRQVAGRHAGSRLYSCLRRGIVVGALACRVSASCWGVDTFCLGSCCRCRGGAHAPGDDHAPVLAWSPWRSAADRRLQQSV